MFRASCFRCKRILVPITEDIWNGSSPNIVKRKISVSQCRRRVVLGIETSCDDTGCAIVNEEGTILGEALHSQQQVHLNHGGIIPPIARDLHSKHIDRVFNDALTSSRLKLEEIDAIATTVKPGLPLSLAVGMNYGKHLSRISNKPFIPIHHMEAHALTIRMVQKVEFPFLVLLISGGHCLLAVVQDVDKFLLLGQSLDDAPGEAFDKMARRLKLRNMPEFRTLSGGAAVQSAAWRGDPLSLSFPSPLSQYRDCNFSVAGLKNTALRHIVRLEKLHDIEGDGIIPNVFDLCASFQMAITKHLCWRLQRAMEYVALRDLIPENRQTLVVSGGVACNSDIVRTLNVVCQEYSYKLAVPPPHLCTDNGVMIAWNGVERLKANTGVTRDLDGVDIQAKCKLGDDIRADVVDANISCKWVKLGKLAQVIQNTNASHVEDVAVM